MKHPPYHLRANKAVDRLLLIEAMRQIGEKFPPISDFTYHSLGGPFLEDFRTMDEQLSTVRLVSLEKDSDTFRRQKVHNFCSRLKLHYCSISNFLQNYHPRRRDVFWLDYTNLKRALFVEFQQVLDRVMPGSVVKITLRAEPPRIQNELVPLLSDEILSDLRKKLIQSLIDKIGAFLPNAFDETYLEDKKFAEAIAYAVQIASEQILRPSATNLHFLPIHLIRYRDGSQMVSVTGIKVFEKDIENVKFQLRKIPSATFSWEPTREIALPDLSLTERLRLGPALPRAKKNPGNLKKKLGYNIANTDIASAESLQQYAEFHRYYPQFVKLRY